MTAGRENLSRVVVRPIGTPLPLGFLGLFGGSFLLAALELRWVPVTEAHLVALALLVFPVPLQGLTSVLAFQARDVATGTAMGVLSGTWAATGLITLLSPPGTPSAALGVFLLLAAASLAVPTVLAATSKLLASAVTGLAVVRFAVTAGYQLSAGPGWREAAGALGVAAAMLAFYGAVAFELESGLGRTVFPTLRRGSGKVALSGELADQVSGLPHEAGVRTEL